MLRQAPDSSLQQMYTAPTNTPTSSSSTALTQSDDILAFEHGTSPDETSIDDNFFGSGFWALKSRPCRLQTIVCSTVFNMGPKGGSQDNIQILRQLGTFDHEFGTTLVHEVEVF